MTDCDLCGRGIPTVNPVRVQAPRLKYAYPEGIWTGLCEACLEAAQSSLVIVETGKTHGIAGKCNLCGAKADVYPVELQVPDFSKGTVKKNVMLCETCLKASGEAFVKFKREQIEGHGHH